MKVGRSARDKRSSHRSTPKKTPKRATIQAASSASKSRSNNNKKRVEKVDPQPIAKAIRVLLMSDHALMRAALHALIQRHAGIKVIGEVRNDASDLAGIREQSDIVLIDLDSNADRCLGCLPQLSQKLNGARLLVLTGAKDPETYHRVIRLGAMGVVLKEQSAEVLVKAIDKVHNGEIWLERSVMAEVLRDMSGSGSGQILKEEEAARIASLTKREREVIGLIGGGLKSKQLAERLFISEITVRHHLTSIYDKLGVADRFELVFYAYRHGLAKLPA